MVGGVVDEVVGAGCASGAGLLRSSCWWVVSGAGGAQNSAKTTFAFPLTDFEKPATIVEVAAVALTLELALHVPS